jgi:glycosyltransferase involved in cell wall biosynthesis
MAKATAPLVSVVIAAYNAETTIAEQLEALARQRPTFTWEVLVCDNGSTDGTAALVRSWSDRLPELRLVDASKRRGAGAARNTGASVARGTFLLFCDADDVVADDWIVRMHDSLQQFTIVGGAGEPTRLNPVGRGSVSWAADTVIRKPFWPQFPAAPSSNLGVASEAFRAIGGFDESLQTAEDIDLCWRIQLAGGTFSRVTSVVVHLRKRTGVLRVFRQARSYALGDRQLQAKHASLIAAYWREHTPVASRDTDNTQRPTVRRQIRRMLRLFTPDGRADAAWRVGSLVGSRSSKG